jgi:hypothetical protein
MLIVLGAGLRRLPPLFGLLACGGGCTLIGNFTTEQCTADADCAVLGGAYRCHEQRCVLSGSGGGSSCTAHWQCPEVSSSPSICNFATGVCAPLRVPGGPCQKVEGALPGKDAVDPERDAHELVILAVFTPFPVGGIGDSRGSYATQVAVREINDVGGFSVPGTSPLRRAQVVALICDQNTPDNEASVALSAELARLRDDVGVHAYVSEMTGPALKTYAQNAWQSELVLAARANEPLLHGENVDQGHLLWHALGSLKQLEPVYHFAIQEAVERAAAEHSIAETAVKIAFVDQSTQGGYANLGTDVGAGLRPQEPPDALQSFKLTGTDNSAVQNFLNELKGFTPHVVVDFMGDLFADMVVPMLNADSLFATTIYVGSPMSRYSEGLLLDAQTKMTDVRFVGVEFNTDYDRYQAFHQSVQQYLPEAVGGAYGHNIVYDSIYILSFAAFRAGVTNLTPKKLADSLPHLASGTPIDVGTKTSSSFQYGIDQLGLVQEIQFVGTTGPLDWDDATGSRNMDIIGTYCIDVIAGAGSYRFGARHFEVQGGTAEFQSGVSCFAP